MVAIREVVDYDAWTPQTETTLDLRLGIFTDEAVENDLIARKSAEMGLKLTHLYTQASYLSADGYAKLLENAPNLEVLNLACAYKTGDTALGVIANFQNLKELNLSFARNEPFIESLGTISRCADLGAVEHITDAGVAKILAGCTRLTSIDLSGTHITVKTLEAVARAQNITTLKVHSCWNLNKEVIASLRAARPDMTVIEERNVEDQTAAFQVLATQVKHRYYMEKAISGGRFILMLQPQVSENERELIEPSAFLSQ